MKTFLIVLFVFANLLNANSFENYLNFRAGIEEYKGDVKCATKYETQLRILLNNQDKTNYSVLKLIPLDAPVRTDSLRTVHFTLHWDETGTNAVPLEDLSANGIPDYIDTAAVVLEHVWDVEINQMNYTAPPQQNGQPTTNYHVYFTDMSYYGVTTGSGIDIPSLHGINWTSYLELENDYRESIFVSNGLDGLRVTAAHEFHHAIQFGYNVRTNGQDFFFYEMTSTWLEDVIYSEVNDYYNYLPTLFINLGTKSFDDYSIYAYGNSLYLHMLDKQFGSEIVRNIWNQIRSEPALEAIGAVLLSSFNSSWLESLAEYNVWLYFTGNRSNSDLYFEEGEFYPQIHENRIESINFEENLQIETNVLANSGKYIKLQNIDRNLSFNLTLSSMVVQQAGFNALSSINASTLNKKNSILQNFQSNEDSVVFVITNAENIEDDFKIISLNPNEFKINQNYPNPFNNKTSILVEIINNTRFSLKIYNSLGEEIKVLQKSSVKSPGFYIYDWNGQNNEGMIVSSGIYFAAFESNLKRKTVKIIYVK